MEQLQQLTERLDACQTLAAEQYALLLRLARQQLGAPAAQFLAQLNVGRQRVVLDTTSTSSISLSKLCEEYLNPSAAGGVRGLCIVVHGELEARRKKRSGSLPDGVKYIGSGFPGRVSYQPSERTSVPQIGKQSAAWERTLHGTPTHKISGHQVRLVQPNPALLPWRSPITGAAPAPQGSGVVIRVADPHPFKSGQNVVTLVGVHESLDGHFEVVRKESEVSFWVKGARAADVQAIDLGGLTALLSQQPRGQASAEERYTLLEDPCMYHIIISPIGPQAASLPACAASALTAPAMPMAMAMAAAPMQFGGQQGFGMQAPGMVPLMLGGPGLAFEGQQAVPLGPLPQQTGKPSQFQVAQAQAQAQQALSGSGFFAQLVQRQQPPQSSSQELAAQLEPRPTPVIASVTRASFLGSLLVPGPPSPSGILHSWGTEQQQDEQPAPSPRASPWPAPSGSAGGGGRATGSVSLATGSSRGGSSNMGRSPRRRPSEPLPASSSYAGAGGAGGEGDAGGDGGGGDSGGPSQHGCRRYFFTERAIVGGPDPGPIAYPGQRLVVQGDAQVTGDLKVQTLLQTSDLRRKVDVAVAVELDSCMKLVSGIATYTYRFKGQEAQQLGFVAQQVQEQVMAHGVERLGLVQADARGELGLSMQGMLALLFVALQGAMKDVQQLRNVELQSIVTSVGLLDLRMGAFNAALRQLLTRGASQGTAGLQDAMLAGEMGPARGSGSTLSAMLEDADELDDELVADVGEAEAGAGEEEGTGPDEPSSSLASNSMQLPPAVCSAMFEGVGDAQAAGRLAERLGEEQRCAEIFKRFIEELGRETVLEVLEDTLGGPVGLTSQGNRARSLGGQFIKLAKKRIHNAKIRKGAETGSGPSDLDLRSYQRRIVEVARTGGNLIIVAPTGSGKTLIAIAHSAYVLREDPSQRIVFLSPTVALAQQQAGAYLRTPPFSSGQFLVECRCGENPVASWEWDGVLAANHVVVMTPQSLLNLLQGGHAHFDRLSQLILDECHHAKDDHPTSRVLAHFHRSSKATQVIGLTASPVSKASMDATYQGLATLQKNMDATFVILDKDNPHLREFVPEVLEQLPILVYPRQEDLQLGAKLGAFVVLAIQELQMLDPLTPLAEQQELPLEVKDMLLRGKWCATAAKWCLRAATHLHACMAPQREDLTLCLLLVRGAVGAISLVEDIGYEAAVRHLSKEIATVAEKVVGSVEALHGLLMLASAQYEHTLVVMRQLLASCLDVDTVKEAYRHAFAGLSNHPRFQALRGVLKKFSLPASFHGIVFARTREAVRSLARLLRDDPDLQGVEVHTFMGHGGYRGEGGAKGMRVKEQQRVMEQFRQPGRKLLVSTSAGEEGIDIPNCAFVIRYTATQTGRERIQSKGRTRKLGSEYIEILEAGSQEQDLSAKSVRQEMHMHQALKQIEAITIE